MKQPIPGYNVEYFRLNQNMVSYIALKNYFVV